MLSELRITGLGVILDAVIEPAAGFTAVTGETGAGKTMVVTALGLAGGGRADVARVRTGAERAVVESRWEVPPGPAGEPILGAVAAAGGSVDDDGSVICVRTVSAEGRSRAHVGGRSVPLSVLTEITEPLLAVHGQSEAISLLRPAAQRDVLDAFAGAGVPLERYRSLRTQWQSCVADLADRTHRARERAEREQVLRMGLAEIDTLGPRPGEDVALVATVRRLENTDAVRSAAQGALSALSFSMEAGQDAPNVSALLAEARRDLAGSGDPDLTRWDTTLAEAAAAVNEVGSELSAYLDGLDADPAALETALTRQSALRALGRRFGADADAILAWADDARRELERLDSSEGTIAALRAEAERLAGEVTTAAKVLSRKRMVAAKKLGAAATAELEHLAMGRARIRVAVTAREAGSADPADLLVVDGTRLHAGPDGIDHVEVLLTAHQGAPELPLQRGASGGELSRVMLALEVVLAGADTVGTLVFDEVDAGVGGRAATEIGRRLAALAATHQVIVVTHLAQVAAFADAHFVVDAGDDGSVGSSSVSRVQDDRRVAELARMLGGTDTDSAIAHAADLLTAASH
ncbi:DNA repair protein RecN [Nakamurella sp. A5-74]|uniref:DNA repair protein RecN n=1 Tax=Nakamurella sp. A5-74 TaxID=3158264 RepID=A0AAU8DKN9_9ACTN